MPPQPKVLILPGLYGSGPEHWQSQWEKQNPTFTRVEQRDWDTPTCHDWVATIDAAIRAHNDHVILVGHSLGATVIAHWAHLHKRNVVGALLVAPSDTEKPSFPKGATGFAPIPTDPLPFPTTVIASTDDPFTTLDRTTKLAHSWGSKLISIGPHGHINVAAGFGPWPEGLQHIADLTINPGAPS